MGATSEMHIAMQDEIMNTIHAVEEGNKTSLDAFIELRHIQSQLKAGIAMIGEYESEWQHQIQIESEEHQNEYRGNKIEFRNGRQSFDFKHLEDWQKADAEKKKIEAKYKTAFKTHQKGMTPIDEDTGEVIEMPKVSIGKSSIVVKKINQ